MCKVLIYIKFDLKLQDTLRILKSFGYFAKHKSKKLHCKSRQNK